MLARTERLVLLALALSLPALAWDGNQYWNAKTTAATSGADGLWGTGGRSDARVTCTSCHQKDATTTPSVGLTLSFSPALQQVGTAEAYRPTQKYTITATLTGESKGLSGCGQYVTHTNGFGASFELASGDIAGRVESDLGMNATTCPATIPMTLADSTITYGDCHAIVSAAAIGRTTWTFAWTAPAAGSGTVSLNWGVVDGNCDMMSMGDDAKNGVRPLVEGIVTREPRRGARAADVGKLAGAPLRGALRASQRLALSVRTRR